MNTLYFDVRGDNEKAESVTYVATINIIDHNEAIKLIFDIINHTETNPNVYV